MELDNPSAKSSDSNQSFSADGRARNQPASELAVPQRINLKSRSKSHTLLTSSSLDSASRKSRSETGVTDAAVVRYTLSTSAQTASHNHTQSPSSLRHPLSHFLTGDSPYGSARMDDGHGGSSDLEGGRTKDDYEKSGTEGRVHADSPASQSVRSAKQSTELEGNRLSFSSLFSMGSAMHSAGHPPLSGGSASSSVAGSLKSNHNLDQSTASGPMSPPLVSSKMDASSAPTTATDSVSVTTSSHSHKSATIGPSRQAIQAGTSAAARNPESWDSGSLPRLHNPAADRRSRSRTQRRPSGSAAGSSASPSNADRKKQATLPSKGTIGVCALDNKARSKPSRNILRRLQNDGEFEVILFGDKVILDEAVENWPLCDYLISFFSDGFPLDKAISYTQLRKPFCVNDLPMQKVLWDRRLCLRILDKLNVPTPKRIEVNRDGGPTLESSTLAEHVFELSGVRLDGPSSGVGGGLPVPQTVQLSEDGDTLSVDGVSLKKPFVEKPVSGEDHNVYIYFPKSHNGGGGRRLFRKIGNKSSEWDSNLIMPRAVTESNSSYIYEQFLDVQNAEDVKAYTVGSTFCHAETRKSPVVDGLVRRNTHGKEIRYITSLTKEEAVMAAKIAEGFGQRICGFDLLRVGDKSYVIDVNGWSFVKDNNEYYDKCASILRQMFVQQNPTNSPRTPPPNKEESSEILHPQHKLVPHHRGALSSILRSPSLSKIRAGHNRSHRSHTSGASPDLSGTTTPISSPATIERENVEPRIGSTPAANETYLSVPASENPDGNKGTLALPEGQRSNDDIPMPAAKHSWKLKGMVSVIRHADRTPKQKFKFTFHTQPFVELLRGHQEEVLLKGEAALGSVLDAVKKAIHEGVEDPEKLSLLRTSLARKGGWAGTKVQIKPMFKKRKLEESPVRINVLQEETSNSRIGDEELQPLRTTRSDSLTGTTLSRFSAAENDLVLDKLQLIIKWGGEPTHAARYQAQDLGENMRNDLLLMNREAFGDVRVFTSSERRVSTSAQIWAASFLDQKDVPDSFITVRKDLLDDSNAAKDIMDKVKKKLKLLLREGHEAPPQFAWPTNMPQPYVVVRRVAELMRFHRKVMRHNFNKLGSSAIANLAALNDSHETYPSSTTQNAGHSLAQAQAVAYIQARWCCGEDAELFKERWEKLFAEFADSEKVDPSKISELYDTMKFDALHNRQFLEWVFTPSQSTIDEVFGSEPKKEEELAIEEPSTHSSTPESPSEDNKHPSERQDRRGNGTSEGHTEKTAAPASIAQRMGFRKKSMVNVSAPLLVPEQEEAESYFKLYRGGGKSRAKQDARLEYLRELFQYAKVLFDFICPQEYGISDSEKLEIGLLTSLPLLREITSDLEEVQASDYAKTFVYFTKESHIYTLLNSILEGGVKTKIARNAIPELDYLSQICFELYEAEDKEADTFEYSIRISISPGCHTSNPLDLVLDSKHSIGCAPRRSLTAHADWKEVIETLRDKFHTVKLPKSFLAINLSDKHVSEGHVEGDSTDKGLVGDWLDKSEHVSETTKGTQLGPEIEDSDEKQQIPPQSDLEAIQSI